MSVSLPVDDSFAASRSEMVSSRSAVCCADVWSISLYLVSSSSSLASGVAPATGLMGMYGVADDCVVVMLSVDDGITCEVQI